MDKIKNILSPGHKDDDAKMYDTSSASKQDTTQTGNLAGDTTHHAKNTPGSHHPKAGDDPSKVSEHMPGAFANTPRDELSSTAGGLGGGNTTGTSSTAHHTANPAHSTTAAPASAAAAAASKPVHGSTTAHSSTTVPHATTAAPASSTAAASTVPVHAGGAADDASTSSIKSGVKGGLSTNTLPSSTATSHAGPGSIGQVGSTAVHTTRETVSTPQGTSTVRSTTTTGLAPDGTPLHSHTHRERETAPQQASTTGHSVGHYATHPSTGATGTATVPVSGSGSRAAGGAHHPQDPSFSNRTLGHDHYGSLDPTTTSTGVGSLGNFSTDPNVDTTAHRARGPHQDTHPIQGTGVGVGSALPTSQTTLPDRSRGGINEPGTRAAVGETSTYSSFPVGGEHVSGPHKTATANILDPHVPQSGVASSLGAHSPTHQTSGNQYGSNAAGTSGVATAVAGAVGANQHTQHSQTGAGPVNPTSTMATPSQHGVASHGGAAGVAGTGVAPGHHAEQTQQEAAAQKSITGDYSHSTEHKSSSHTAGAAAVPSGQHDHKTHQRPSETGQQSRTTGDQTKHHNSRDTTTGGATTSHVPLAGTDEGRKADLGEHVDKGPASKTMGPHSSNILNVLDPRVKPDAAVQASDKTKQIDPRVEGPAGTAGTHQEQRAASGAHEEQRAASGTHDKTRHASSDTHSKGSEHGTTSETQRLSSDPAKHGDPTGTGSHGDTGVGHPESTQEHDSGRHGLSSLLHRDNPNKLHKDPPSK